MTTRRKTVRWVGTAVVLIVALAVLTAWLTAPRPGGRMDPTATSAEGARALVTLLREAGVDVEVADTVAQARAAARPDSLTLVAQTPFTADDDALAELAAAPGDLLLVEPNSFTREALAPAVRTATSTTYGGEPDCELPAAQRAGVAQFGPTGTFEAAEASGVDLTSCYSGALVRYRADGRTVTVVSSAGFLTNGMLLDEGNAALAMNLTGEHPRLIWYAPQRAEGENLGTSTVFDMIPPQWNWVVWQLWLTVALVAIWKGRRLGPLVAERLPVVVRASETAEGRARLYRAHRARDRAADALRSAALQRLAPRLGLGAGAQDSTLVLAVAQRTGADPFTVGHTLFGPAPASDAELLQLAHALDDIERQVAHS